MYSRLRLLTSLVSFILSCFTWAAGQGPARDDEITWRVVGPGGGGSTFLAAVSPHDPDLAFLSADVGPTYRTRDGGKTWQPVARADRDYWEPYCARGMRFDAKDPKDLWMWGLRGLYESRDEGDTWECLSRSFPTSRGIRGGNRIAMVAIDPSNEDIIYAAPGMFGMTGGGPEEVYKTTDRGKSWSKLNTGMEKFADFAKRPSHSRGQRGVFGLEVDPAAPRRVYASTGRAGFFASADAGETWTQKGADVFIDGCGTMTLMREPQTGNTLIYVVANTSFEPGNTSSWRGGVYLSRDGGETWTERNAGILKNVPANLSQVSRYFFLCSAGLDSGVLYLGTRAYGNWNGLVHRTTDWGATWAPVTDQNRTRSWGWGGPHVFSMGACAADPKVAYFATRGAAFKTDDGGKSWRQVSSVKTLGGRWRGTGHEVIFVNKIVVDPFDPQHLYIGANDMGVFTSHDAGETYTIAPPLGEGRFGTVYDAIAVDPDVKGVVCVGYEVVWGGGGKDNGIIVRSRDAGKTWDVVGAPATGLVHPPPEQLSILTWNRCRPFPAVNSLAIDRVSPKERRTIYAALRLGGVFKSEDGGERWAKASRDFDVNAAQLMIHPRRRNVLYAVVRAMVGKDMKIRPGGLFISQDAGAHWQRIASMPGVNPTKLGIAASDPSVMYVTCWRNASDRYTSREENRGYDKTNRGGVYRSTDGGASWTRVLDEPQCDGLAINPSNASIVYAGSADRRDAALTETPGLYRTIDGGATWRRHNRGLSNTRIDCITIAPGTPRTIYVGTTGGGLHKSKE